MPKLSQDDLFDLIASLNRSEKRYVKIYASQHTKGEKSNYMRLFEAMAAQKAYDEAALRKKFKGEKFIKHLSSEKNYLFRFILKALRAYQREASVPLELMEMLMESEILQDRGLYARSHKWLERAANIAATHELFWMQLEILDRKRLLVKAYEHKSPTEEIEKLIQQKDDLLRRIDQRYQYQDIYEVAFLQTRKTLRADGQDSLKLLESRLGELETSFPEGPGSFSARIYALNLQAVIHRFKGDKALAWNLFEELVALWEAHLPLQKMHPPRYRIALSNFLASCFETERYGPVPETLAKLRAVPTAHFDLEAEVFQNSFFFELLYLINTGQFQAATELVPDILSGLQTYSEKVNQARVLAFYFNIAMVYFILEDFGGCRDFIDRIIDESGSRHREDLQRMARLFHLLLHLEKGNFDLLEYQHRSVQRYLAQQKTQPEKMVQLLHFIYKARQHGRHPLPARLYDGLLAMLAGEGPLPGGTEIGLWARARRDGCAIVELLD